MFIHFFIIKRVTFGKSGTALEPGEASPPPPHERAPDRHGRRNGRHRQALAEPTGARWLRGHHFVLGENHGLESRDVYRV